MLIVRHRVVLGDETPRTLPSRVRSHDEHRRLELTELTSRGGKRPSASSHKESLRPISTQRPPGWRSRACCFGRQRVLAWRAVGLRLAALSSRWGCGGPDRGYDRGAVDSYYLHYLIWFGVLMAVAGVVFALLERRQAERRAGRS
jgi:hypothetical protein